jgi:hypothetical protein
MELIYAECIVLFGTVSEVTESRRMNWESLDYGFVEEGWTFNLPLLSSWLATDGVTSKAPFPWFPQFLPSSLC